VDFANSRMMQRSKRVLSTKMTTGEVAMEEASTEEEEEATTEPPTGTTTKTISDMTKRRKNPKMRDQQRKGSLITLAEAQALEA
jgi:hypothetical protein